jgi:hypothetical protein
MKISGAMRINLGGENGQARNYRYGAAIKSGGAL